MEGKSKGGPNLKMGRAVRRGFTLEIEGGRAEQGRRNLEMEGHGAGRADLTNEERDEGQTSEMRSKDRGSDLKYETGSSSKGNH